MVVLLTGGKTRVLLRVSIVTLLFLATAAVSAQAAPSNIVIGLAISSLDNPYCAEIRRGSEDAGKEWNFQVVVQDAAGQAASQKANIERFIAEKVNAILVDPIDPQLLAAPVQAAIKAGIPVITFGKTTISKEGVVHVDTNNRMIGRRGFEVLAERVSGEGTILEVALRGTSESKDRSAGFELAVKEQTRLKLVAKVEAADRQEASVLVQKLLKETGPVNAIFAHNDELAVGAVKAFNVVAPSVPLVVIGVGGNNDMLKMIKLGKATATVFEKPWDIGHIATETALRILKGGKPAKFIPVDVVVFPAP